MRTLLIVDDQEGVLHALAYVFTERGYRTLVAKSGAAALALALAARESFDAALIDLHMPGMDGLTLCGSLRTLNPALPVWIMTAACTREAEAKAREIGVVAVLKKPFDVNELIRALEARFAPSTPVATTPGPITDGSAHAV